MSAVDDGGPAFPVHETPDSTDHIGMTLRDYFAAKAMQGYMENFAACGVAAREKGFDVHDFVAIAAYEMADAMLKAREVKP